MGLWGLHPGCVCNLDCGLVLAVDLICPVGSAFVKVDVKVTIHIVALDRIVVDARAKSATAVAHRLKRRIIVEPCMGATSH